MIVIYIFILLIVFIVTLILLLFLLAQIISIFTTDAPFVPIPSRIENNIVETLQLKDDSVLYDLGCGDARVLKKALEKNPNIQAIGIELGFVPYLLAKWKSRTYKNLKIRRENIFETDVTNATHIFLYLYPKVMEKLMPILKEKCKKGTRIVSCDFEDKNSKPTEILSLETHAYGRGQRLIVYTI